MATFHAASSGGGTSGTVDRTIAIAATAGDLLLVFCTLDTNTNDSPTCTDDQGGSYAFIVNAQKGASADRLDCFVRTSLVATTGTINATVASGTNQAGVILSVSYSGMTRTGSAAVRQTGIASNQSSGTTPSASFSSACLTGNPTISVVGSGTNPPAITPPTSWLGGGGSLTSGQPTPPTGIIAAYRDSGFTGTVITWGSTSPSTYGTLIVELDASTSVSDTSIQPTAGALSATGNQPSIVTFTNTPIQPASGSLSATGNQPSVTVSGITITNLLAPTGDAVDRSSYLTSSFTVTAGRYYLISFSTSKAGVPDNAASVTNFPSPLTFTQIGVSAFANAASPTKKTHVWGAPCLTTATVTITIDFGGVTQTGLVYAVNEVAGMDGGSGVIVQVAHNETDTGTVMPVTLAPFSSPGNAAFAAFGRATNAPITPGGAFIELSDQGYGTPPTRLETCWFAGDDDPSCITSISDATGGVALEILVAGAAISPVQIQPAAGSLGVTGQSPAAVQSAIRAPASGALGVAGASPAVLTNTIMVPGTGGLNLQATPAALLRGTVSAPAPGVLGLTGATPVTITNIFRAPLQGALSIIGSTPAASTGILRIPSPGSLALSGALGQILLGTLRTPAPGTLTLTGAPPTPSLETRLTTLAGTLTLVGASPIPVLVIYLTPVSGSLSVNGATPNRTEGRILTPGTMLAES